MVEAVLIVLILLWLLGLSPLPGLRLLDNPLFHINNHPISLLNIIVFFVVALLTELLPRPFNIIAGIVLLLWVLAMLGIVGTPVAGRIFLLALIIGLVVYLLDERFPHPHTKTEQ